MSDKKATISLVIQGLATIALTALVVVQVLSWGDAKSDAAELRTAMMEPRYEYKVVVVAGTSNERMGDGAVKPSSITVDEKELSKLGSQGWEIVGSFLEMETAYPNFGKAEYVTGLQTNVRPQRLVLILRHRIG